jgi:hypothetical protein
MRRRTVWAYCVILASLWSYHSAIAAEGTAEALTAFDLIGTWSPDCVQEPGKSSKSLRITYSVPLIGAAQIRSVNCLGSDCNVSELEINSAQRITESKLRIIRTLISQKAIDKPMKLPDPEYRKREVVILKTSAGIRTINVTSLDGKMNGPGLGIKDGMYYRPTGGPISSPAWEPTGIQTETLEKCLN